MPRNSDAQKERLIPTLMPAYSMSVIHDVKVKVTDDAWYTLQGARLNGKPTQRGIYIHGGKKVAVK